VKLRTGRGAGLAVGVARLSGPPVSYLGLIFVAVFLILGVAGVGSETQYTLTLAAAWAIAAIGLDMSTGLAGQALFGQTAFVAIAAYAFTVSASRWHLSVYLAALFAIVLTSILAAIIGSAMVRLRQFGAVLVTFFFAFVVSQLISGTWLASITNGEDGLSAPATGWSSSQLYYISVVLMLLALLVGWNYRMSRSGWALRLIRRNETVAESVGIHPAGRKLAVFVIAAAFAAVAGILLTVSIGLIAPETFDPTQSIILFAMIALGGFGSISGGILGAAVLTLLPQYLQGEQSESDIIYALVLLFFLVVRPDGVVGALSQYGTLAANSARSWIARRTGRAPVKSVPDRAPVTVPDTSVPDTSAPDRVPDPAGDGGPVRVATANVAEASRSEIAELPRGQGLRVAVEDLRLSFGGVHALDGLSLAVVESSIHAIIGPNGAGKTSLLNCISGVESRWSGSITVGERIRTKHEPARRVARSGLSRTFQNASLVLDMSAMENVAIGLYAHQKWSSVRDLFGPIANGRLDREARVRVDEALDLVGIAPSRRLLPVSDLSLAETKLIDIARAGVAHPKLLLLDEPTAGLSGEEIALCADFILELNASRRTTIVVVSHHVGFIRRIAHQATVLDYGCVIGDGEPNALLEDEHVIEAFIGAAQ
jgi:ABC-type branched-subunit amino acid transport system ATPase component/ABC-type branched-subunit amino acid transport system permease subunit